MSEGIERTASVAFVVALALVSLAGLAWNRPRASEKQVLRWARRLRLPRDDQAFADAVRRRTREAKIEVTGSLLGLLVGGLAFVADLGFAGLAVCVTGAIAGQLAGCWLVHTGEGRAEGIRLPERRRLRPAEIVVLCCAPAPPAVMLLLAGSVQRTDAMLLVVAGSLALVLHGAVLLAVWRLLVRDGTTVWERAHRAQLVRELITGTARSAWPLMMVVVLSTEPVGSTRIAGLAIAAMLVWMGVLIAVAALETSPVSVQLDPR
jgi:TRAP-type C4-dicarboxylate transport system permease large subunit